MKGVNHIFKEPISKGSATIVPFTINAKEAVRFNMRCEKWMRIIPGQYVRLEVTDEDGYRKTVMSDTPMELHSNAKFVSNAYGRVLIAGLGLGMLLANILDLEQVKTVTVIELNQDVIDLIGPFYRSEKLTIVKGNAYTYTFPKGQQLFDTIYFDIWTDICSDNYIQMLQLERRYRKYLNKPGYMDSWLKKYCKTYKQRGL